MVQKQSRPKQTKIKKIKLVAKRPGKIKAALKSLVEASDKVDSDPLKIDDAPAWVHNAYAQVVKVIMPGNRVPNSGEVDLELIGEFLGRLQAFGRLYAGEIPMSPELQAEYEGLKKQRDALPKSPERTANEKASAKDLKVRVSALETSIPDLMKAAMASSHEDSIKFQTGLLRGSKLSSDDLVTINVFESHTRTFFVLAHSWQRWVKCKSLGEIYRILCKEIGADKIGSFKTFEKRVAGKIGLTVGVRGRPKSKK
jgi:hypothetical protein